MLNKIILGIGLCLMPIVTIAQTCNSSITKSTPTVRFTPQSGGTVLDTKTNLIWKRCSEGQAWDGKTCTGSANTYNWQQALDLTQGGWRVPNIKELDSIVELSCIDPAINLSVFLNSSSNAVVWSSSPHANYSNSAWQINFHLGNNSYEDALYGQVRLVRSGQ